MPKRKIIQATSTDHLEGLIQDELRLHGPGCDLNHIDVSEIKNFGSLFKGTNFNGNISKWNTANALSFKYMFKDTPFNGDISQWHTSNMLDMTGMFENGAFNGNLSKWDVSNVHCMQAMFLNSAFNGDVSKWNVDSTHTMRYMFANSLFSGDVSAWKTSALNDADYMFKGSQFNGDVSQWDVSELRWCQGMFCTPTFQRDLSAWVLSEHSRLTGLVHNDYMGVLPEAIQPVARQSYLEMLGGVQHLMQYAARTPFSRVHAALLMGNDEDCAWASQEVVRWAREQVKVGRALGLDDNFIRNIMVETYRVQTDITIEAGDVFDALP